MEILSPASNFNHIRVAIDEKSNAVYGGLKQWNARNKAINFSDSDYNLLIDLLHENNIKFFLTLNILLLDEEIDDVILFLKNNKLPDAFIVTDIGLLTTLNKEFPQIPLHFSTQFGAHNIDDVNFIESISGQRAILSRELTLDEITNIQNHSNIELECFVWGSQCLSFSGLCFFGSLINGGGGNRGKCIITCRDVYSINKNKGHYLYVPDMDCINLISKLEKIDCLKLEGRRRNPLEIQKILRQLKEKTPSKKTIGYMNGCNIHDNHLFESINSRIKPIMPPLKLKNITHNDICIKFKDDKPISFSTDYSDPDVMYVYTEIKKDYLLDKKNVSLELKLNSDNSVKEILYINFKGEGHTFYEKNKNNQSFFPTKLNNRLSLNNNINLYKIKYIKYCDNDLSISKYLYNELLTYIINDCKDEKYLLKNNDVMLKTIYLETNDLSVVKHFIDDKFTKIIYDISTINNLKNISKVINLYGDKIIYKLPIFNWKSENLINYYKLLENKEVMFTRFTQIYLCKNIRFKRKYTDYLIYVWNKKTFSYLLENGIEEFTGSPELSFNKNIKIHENNDLQLILCGKLPLVYTRGCFGHIFGCQNCVKIKNKKLIKNEDKNMNYEIYCNSDYRYLLNELPILNDYSKFDLPNNIRFRYITLGQDLESIIRTVQILKKSAYYQNLKKINYWKNSYECNLLEGKE